MFKVVLLTIIVGVTIWTTRANNTKELECREEIERELKEYVKLDIWQELFRQHFKFIVNKDGEILSEKNRLKFNTIIHNAIYGCSHDRNDEVDDCPNIFKGSIKSCKIGRNLRAAMFRTARCTFVESSVKHIVLSDAMLDVYPMDMLHRISMDMDQPIREFGENVANMLSTLSHGEVGGLGELMALNLYLNNAHGTVFMHRVPAEPIASPEDFAVAKRRARAVHGAILDGLYTFWDTWCSDTDVVAQYRRKYDGSAYIVLVSEMDKNARESDEFARGLNVSGNAADLDFEPRRVALADFVERIVSGGSMPSQLRADLRLAAFETSYEFDPRAVYEHQMSVFRAVYACFYWSTIAHLKLALRLADAIGRRGVDGHKTTFVVNFVRYVRPLTVFDISRLHFASALPPEAATHLTRLLAFMLKMYRIYRNPHVLDDGILSSRPIIRQFVDLLSADMDAMLHMQVPDDYFDRLSYEDTLKLMQSNYRAFARLVSATSGFKEDQINVIKLKKFMFFLSEAIDFDGI